MELRDLVLSELVDDDTMFTIQYQVKDDEPWGDYQTTARGHWYSDCVLDFMTFEFEENDSFAINPEKNTCFVLFDHDLRDHTSKECNAWSQL